MEVSNTTNKKSISSHRMNKCFSDARVSEQEINVFIDQFCNTSHISNDCLIHTQSSSSKSNDIMLTIILYQPIGREGEYVSSFSVPFGTRESFLIVVLRVMKITRIPMTEFKLFYGKDEVPNSEWGSAFKLRTGNKREVNMVLCEDVPEYLQKFLVNTIKKRFTRDVSVDNWSSYKERCEMEWNLNIPHEDRSDKLWKSYYEYRKKVESVINDNPRIAESQDNIQNRLRSMALSALCCRTKEYLSTAQYIAASEPRYTIDPLLSDSEIDLFTHMTQSIVVFNPDYWMGETEHVNLLVRIYSPVIPGNSVDLCFYHHFRVRHAYIESHRVLMFQLNTLHSDQSTRSIRKMSDKKFRKTNYIFYAWKNYQKRKDYRRFAPAKRIDRLQRHFFGNQIVSTMRFFNFICAASGVELTRRHSYGQVNDICTRALHQYSSSDQSEVEIEDRHSEEISDDYDEVGEMVHHHTKEHKKKHRYFKCSIQ
jgi:hypothetical protein